MTRIVNTDDAIWVHRPPPSQSVSQEFPARQVLGGRERVQPVSLMTAATVPRFPGPPATVRVPDVRGKSLRSAIVA
ncbi:MAG: hypothetical protein ACE5HZ_09725, partial [Fidelibacterota bacterium]